VIDTHCHLLPGLDDGPRDLEGAVALARQLVDAGVSAVVCTPHFSRRYPTTLAAARKRLVQHHSTLFALEVPLSLKLAAEVSPAVVASAPAEELVARSIGGFLFVELEPNTPAPFIATAFDRLAQEGLRPVFAHPERCPAARRQPRLLEETRAQGALVQVVASSLTHRWGPETEEAAWRLLETGGADLLASDAHRAHRGGSHLEHASALVVERFGIDALHQLTQRAPARILGTRAQPA
jgi:protein-tyrosine phosphatase